ncbi:MAG: hypothetical protein AAFQ17_03785, partial [Pseudomonadota bacterium]
MGLLDLILPALSSSAFTRKAAQRLRNAGVEVEEVKPEQMTIKHAHGITTLGNLYDEYRAAPRTQRHHVFDRVVQVVVTPDIDQIPFEQIREFLRPKLQPRIYYELLPYQIETTDGEKLKLPPIRIVGERHAVEAAIDFEHVIASVNEGNVADWGVTTDQVFDIARENTWRHSNEPWQRLDHGVWASPWQDNWDAGRIWLHDLIWQLDVQGRHVVTTPNRDFVLVTGDENEAGLQSLAQLTEDILNSNPRSLTPAPLRLEGRTWQPFAPDKGEPGYDAMRWLNVMAAVNDYEEQKATLEREFERIGRDIYVATAS